MLHNYLTLGNKLANLEVAALNVPGALARPQVLSELDGTLIVDI